jgi:thiol-disulfide isomerase/thioredoxin
MTMYQPKNLIAALCFILFAFLSSCHEENSKVAAGSRAKINTIEIKGNIKGLNASWVYLSNNYPVGSKPIDSARVINGSFSFKFHPDTVYEPHLVYIFYKDQQNKTGFLGINDPANPKNRYGNFIMEPGTIELTGDLTKNKGVNLNGGPQNKFWLANTDLPFSRISNNAAQHKNQVESFIKKVKDVPDAYYAMFALGNLKFQVSKSELTAMYNVFNDQTKQAYSGRQINEFLANKPDDDALAPNDLLTNSKGKQASLIDTTKKLNMVIFWASWCGPCRQEIPSLKKVAAEIKDKRFRMVSVSVDQDKLAWKKAIGEEKMPWAQLLIDPEIMGNLRAQYNLNAIPQIYLIDGERKLVKHMIGFDPANEEIFKKTIDDFLRTN